MKVMEQKLHANTLRPTSPRVLLGVMCGRTTLPRMLLLLALCARFLGKKSSIGCLYRPSSCSSLSSRVEEVPAWVEEGICRVGCGNEL